MGHVASVGLALLALALAGCGAALTGAPPTPTSPPASTATSTPAATSTPTATATPSVPILRYSIGTRNQTIQDRANVALPVSAGTNYAWTPAKDFQGLTCTPAGKADPGGPPGRIVYQAFTCQLATGQASGQGSFLFAEVGATTPDQRAHITMRLGQ
jgi:hypothetical protein